jgi:hypothetical protein
MLLKKIGEDIVPAGWYEDPAARQAALEYWLKDSLFPLFKWLEEAMVNEFKLIPAMYSYDVCINHKWHKALRKVEEIGVHIIEEISLTGCEYLEIQLVIDLLHPHVRWGTLVNLYLEKRSVLYDDEDFECDVIVMEPMYFSIAEPLSLQAAGAIIENVLIDLRINYVANS